LSSWQHLSRQPFHLTHVVARPSYIISPFYLSGGLSESVMSTILSISSSHSFDHLVFQR
jgi:hypothetical protein